MDFRLLKKTGRGRQGGIDVRDCLEAAPGACEGLMGRAVFRFIDQLAGFGCRGGQTFHIAELEEFGLELRSLARL